MPRTRLPIVQIGAVRGPLAALACLGLVLAAVSGCSSASAAPKNPLAGTCLSGASVPLTIVVGERSNVPSIQFPSAVTSLLNTAATDREPVTLIRIDGKPKVFPVAPFSTSDVSSGAIQQDIRNYVNGVIQILTGSHLHAAAPQADVLGALSLAAEATPAGGNIVVIDSGLQTAGQLMYQNPGVLMSPPSDVVKFLRAGNLIPRLSGRHVLLYGFGYTAAPQAALDQPERENVAAQWKAIVAAGGACVTVNTTPNTNPEMAGLPAVSTVLLPAPPIFKTCGTTVLSNDGSVGFNDGNASFRDPAAARSTLSKLASALKRGTEPITLIGSTSTEGGDAINYPLSTRRAAAVQSVLMSLGVSGSRIKVIGEGAHYPGRVPDVGPDGQLLLAQAEQDREVIVQLPQCR
jgi:outer membrane protein OmpA-like peptidoglycan-associated protein